MPIYKQRGSENWLIEFVIDGKRFRRSTDATSSDPVFKYRNGFKSKPVIFRHPFAAWKSALRRAGIHPGTRMHDLRHTFASRLVKAGVPLFDVSKLLGHKSLSMTMRYAHLSPASLYSAIQRLEESSNTDTGLNLAN